MDWLRVEVNLGDLPPDPVEAALTEFGAASILYSDASDTGADDILEPAPGTAPLWPEVRLEALFEADVAPTETEILLTIAAACAPNPMPNVRVSVLPDEDWVARGQRALAAARYGDRLWVCPPDTPCPDPDAACVRMVPGLGFGTGGHPSTALCLEWLARQPLADATLLDYGCGSGILAISGLALGATCAVAIDNDPQALTATADNAERNGCEGRLNVVAPGEVAPETFDFVVANILSGTLIELAPAILKYAQTGTRIALSGILATQANEVAAAYAGQVAFEPAARRDEWAILYGSVK